MARFIRKRNYKKSFKARTTGLAKRSLKRTVVPGYGKKGMGFIKNPKRSVRNSWYKRTTVSRNDIFSLAFKIIFFPVYFMLVCISGASKKK